MTLVQFLRLLSGRLTGILLLPLLPAAIVFLLTMDAPNEYRSSTLIFTGLASSTDALNDGSDRIDNYAVNNSFDNLLNLISSRAMLERTGLMLLAEHLVQDAPAHGIIGPELFEQLRAVTDESFRARIIAGGTDSAFARLMRERATPEVRAYTDNEHLPYSPRYIDGHLKTKRDGISDMVEMTYASNDAAATQRTLTILTGSFIAEFQQLKSQDAMNLVRFFTEEAAKAEQRLTGITAELKEYRIAHGIINYDEQTKQLTVEEMYMNGELREELRTYAASEASLADLNMKLGNRAERIANNQAIIDLRDRLASASAELLTLQTVEGPSERTMRLQAAVNDLRSRLHTALGSHTAMEHTVEGTNIALLEQQWMQQYIAAIEGKVRIDVFKERRAEFRNRFNTFAPLGSTLHKFERDIDVAEKEYLELLHSLNMARLRQQNLEASNAIKVLDAPLLPLKAEPSKRGLLIAGAWIISVLFSIILVTALELFDHNIRTPERAAQFSQLPVMAAFPDLSVPHGDGADARSFSLIRNQMLRNLKLELMRSGNTVPPRTIIICSVLGGEGKSTVAAELSAALTAQGTSVTALLPHEPSHPFAEAAVYTPPQNFSGVKQVRELMRERKRPGSDLIILELPPLQQNEIPLHLLRSASLVLFVMRADRIWRSSDSAVLGFLRGSEPPPLCAVVNGVRLERIEEFTGELPKTRSALRSTVKRLAEFRFQRTRKG